MDVAMQLYAERGLNGVSLREINAQANFSSSAIRYHFKTQDVLVDELIASMQPAFFNRRKEALGKLEQQAKPRLQSIVKALVLPLSDIIREEPKQGIKQLRFLARLYFDGDKQLANVFEESWSQFKPLLKLALPKKEEQTLRLKWLFSSELTLHTLANQEILFKRAHTHLEQKNYDDFVQSLINYVCAGLKA